MNENTLKEVCKHAFSTLGFSISKRFVFSILFKSIKIPISTLSSASYLISKY